MKPLALYALLTALLICSGIALTFARFEARTHEPEQGLSEAAPLETEAPDAGCEDASVSASSTTETTGMQTGILVSPN